jgi:hypothetical protein
VEKYEICKSRLGYIKIKNKLLYKLSNRKILKN